MSAGAAPPGLLPRLHRRADLGCTVQGGKALAQVLHIAELLPPLRVGPRLHAVAVHGVDGLLHKGHDGVLLGRLGPLLPVRRQQVLNLRSRQVAQRGAGAGQGSRAGGAAAGGGAASNDSSDGSNDTSTSTAAAAAGTTSSVPQPQPPCSPAPIPCTPCCPSGQQAGQPALTKYTPPGRTAGHRPSNERRWSAGMWPAAGQRAQAAVGDRRRAQAVVAAGQRAQAAVVDRRGAWAAWRCSPPHPHAALTGRQAHTPSPPSLPCPPSLLPPRSLPVPPPPHLRRR